MGSDTGILIEGDFGNVRKKPETPIEKLQRIVDERTGVKVGEKVDNVIRKGDFKSGKIVGKRYIGADEQKDEKRYDGTGDTPYQNVNFIKNKLKYTKKEFKNMFYVFMDDIFSFEFDYYNGETLEKFNKASEHLCLLFYDIAMETKYGKQIMDLSDKFLSIPDNKTKGDVGIYHYIFVEGNASKFFIDEIKDAYRFWSEEESITGKYDETGLLLSKYLDAFFPYLISFSNDIGLFDESPEDE